MAKNTKKKAARRSGRPRGSATKQRKTIVDHGARCPKCGSTEIVKERLVKSQQYNGVSDGKPFTHIDRVRATCSACGQHLILTRYRNEVV